MRNFIMWDSIQRFKFTLHLKHANFINLSQFISIYLSTLYFLPLKFLFFIEILPNISIK